MKRFDIRSISAESWSAVAAIYFIIAVMIPNVTLSFTENYGLWTTLCNLILPAGIYLCWAAAARRGGVMVLWGIIFMFFAAFQIVLLSLFGNSIIGADMFTNVLTTNPGEAKELLGNISGPVAIVCLIYLPLIALGIYVAAKHYRYGERFRRVTLRCGAVLTFVGIVLLLPSYLVDGGRVLRDKIFPANVSYNLALGFSELINVKSFDKTSAGFSYEAHRTAHAAEGREVYIFVIGEASRAYDWQLYGYDRQTNPRLSNRDDIVVFRNVITQSNTTHKSVPMILSSVATDQHDELYRRKGVPLLFNEAGFKTFFISNQAPQGAMIDNLANDSGTVEYLDRGYDSALVDRTKRIMRDNPDDDLFIILHCYGSHFSYNERYPREFAQFTPDTDMTISGGRSEHLRNAYDNSVLYTDYMLASLIDAVDADGGCAAVLYCSDHGEDLLDDDRRRFLHASPTVTYYQLHVAALAWFSASYCREFADKVEAAEANVWAPATTHALFHTLADMASIEGRYVDTSVALSSSDFDWEAPRYYLDDHNRAEKFDASIGLNDDDYRMFYRMGITRL